MNKNNTRKSSVKIGTFEKDKKGVIHGSVFGLGIGLTPVVFEPQTSKEGKQYFRLIADTMSGGYEIGVAFPKDKDGMHYHSVSIESPVLPAPINAALFEDKEAGGFNLVWSRPESGQSPNAQATVNVNMQGQSQAAPALTQTSTRRSPGSQPRPQ